MSEIKPSVGFIGLGIMGFAMAINAKKAGFPVRVFNRSSRPIAKALEAGLHIEKSPKELSEKSDVIVTMVSDPHAIHNVLNGENGVFSSQNKGKTLIQMSTLDRATTLSVAAQAISSGMSFLDCPVTGSKKQVEAGQLILLAGGDLELIKKCETLLLSMGKAIVHAGVIGQGTALKLCMNLIVAQLTTALCESVALAQQQDLDVKKIFEVIHHSPALNCGYFQIKEQALLTQDFSPAFSLENMLKDVRFMVQFIKEKKHSLPVTEAVCQLMEKALQAGLGKEDLTAIFKILK
ncbi:MAG: NAD(P)-dependent oxidoreductase [Elusimicrobiota bacterium]